MREQGRKMKTKQTKAEKADALLRRAWVQLEGARYPTALRLFRAAAELGDSIAMQSLGYFYDVGQGGRKDRDLAMQWYRRAWRRGDASSASNIGTIYRDEKDYKRAFAWFDKSIAAGDVSANFEVARVYMDHLDDTAKAVRYLRVVAKAKPGIDVTKWEWERARLFLDGLAAQKAHRQKRASRLGGMRVLNTRKP